MRVILDVLEGPRKGQTFKFAPGELHVFGRSRHAHCSLPEDAALSREHFALEVQTRGCELRDLESTNGTYVNEQKVDRTQIHTGDRIAAGSSLFGVRLVSPDDEVETVDRPLESNGVKGGDRQNVLLSLSHGNGCDPEDSILIGGRTVRCVCCGSMAPSDLQLPEETEGDSTQVQWICQLCRDEVISMPQPVPHYTTLRELGRGGMGVVLLARHNRTKRLVALKLIVPDCATSRSMVDRFLREMSVISQMKHPNIVVWLEQGMTRGQFWFAMEYVDGPNLETVAQERPGSYPIRQGCRMACQVLRGLEHAHSLGFVHRDIKPENILIGRAETGLIAKISDFGLAKSYRGIGLSNVTTSGEMRGTMPFMPPEQIKDFRNVLPSGDLYATAATLYYMLTGAYIYAQDPEGSSAIETLLETDPVPIRQHRSEIPAELERVLSRCLAREPADRYPNATAMRLALRPFC